MRVIGQDKGINAFDDRALMGDGVIQIVIEAWLTCAAQTVFLLECLTPEQWEAEGDSAKPIRSQFAHIHNVRLMWLKMSDKSLVGPLEQADRRKGTQAEIRTALLGSAAAIARMLHGAGSPEGTIKGFGRSAVAFLTSSVAHEAYHRGQIELLLRQAGIELDDQHMLRLWDHSKMLKFSRELFPAVTTKE